MVLDIHRNVTNISFAEALRENRALTEPYLAHNGIGDEGGSSLSEGLSENITLVTLDL
ncbi:MAG: hypothetical protein SFT91_06470 [Rickettsiaceae bacterium]|nr:hypothetical protein [Rickettsiaceae bacterium]